MPQKPRPEFQRPAMSRSRMPWRLSPGLVLILASCLASTLPAGAHAQQADLPLPNASAFDPSAALNVLELSAAGPAPAPSALAPLAGPVQVDPLLGQATSRLSVEVPPGRKGMTPELALTYASRGANGLFGRGWDPRLPAVKRSTSHGAPVDYADPTLRHPVADGEYALLLPHQNTLLDVNLGILSGKHVFASSAEEQFSQVLFDDSQNRWTVTNKAGVRYTFGAGGPETRLGTSNSAADTAVWALTEIVDPNGNTITYEYKTYEVEGTANRYIYPAAIHYGGNPRVGISDIFHVCFAYDHDGTDCDASPVPRPDPLVNYMNGQELRLAHRVSGISVWVDGESTQSQPTRRYEFSYSQDPDSNESRLVQVRLFGKNGETLRPAGFSYTVAERAFGPWRTLSFHFSSRHLEYLRYNAGTGEYFSDLIDLNGDSRPDWIEVSDYPWRFYVHLNLGDGYFGPRQDWGEGQGFHYWVFDIVDMNGDALPDLVYTPLTMGPEDWQVRFNTGHGFDEAVTYWTIPGSPSDPSPNPTNVFNHQINPSRWGGLYDLNGDGLPDLVNWACSECGFNETGEPEYCDAQVPVCRVWLNTGSGFDLEGTLWTWPSIGFDPGQPAVTRWWGSGLTVAKLADLNGDGLLDLVDSRPVDGAGQWAVYLNTGRGFALSPDMWSAPTDDTGQPMHIAQVCEDSGGNHRGLRGGLRDMNGDGRLDYVDSNNDCDNLDDPNAPAWRVFLNDGQRFLPPVTWGDETSGLMVQRWHFHVPHPTTSTVMVQGDTMDVNGDGLADYVEGRPCQQLPCPGGDSTFMYLHVKYSLGAASGLLERHDDGLGGWTDITYALSNDLRRGPVCSRSSPEYHHTPFALTVVDSLTTSTGLQGSGHQLEREYCYDAPYYDWQEREFRGFRTVVGAQGRYSDPLRRSVTYEFLQPGAGPADPLCVAPGVCPALSDARPFKGKLAQTYTTGRTRNESLTRVWDWRRESRPDGRQRIFLAEQAETLSGGAGQTRRLTYEYDAFNSPTKLERYTDANLIGTTTTAYAYDIASYIMDRPSTIQVAAPDGTVLSRRQFTYSSRGNVMGLFDWLDNDVLNGGGERTIARARLEYTSSAGAAGLPTRIFDAEDNLTAIAYGCSNSLYACTITNPEQHRTDRAYSLEFGKPTSVTDPNGATTTLTYDGLGRLRDITRPLDSEPWRKFFYVQGLPGSPWAMPTRIETKVREPNRTGGYRTVIDFYDSLGRKLETKSETRLDGMPATIVTNAAILDQLGRVSKRLAVYETSGNPIFYEMPVAIRPGVSIEYDALDRVTRLTKPDGRHREMIYDPAGVTEVHDENYTSCSGCGKKTVEQRDAFGRLKSVMIYEGDILETGIINTHDALDRRIATSTLGFQSMRVTFEYDSLGRRIALSDKDSGTWRYGYDDRGNLVYQDDPNLNQHLEFCYDALGRPTRRSSESGDAFTGDECLGGSSRASYRYDLCSYGTGRLCSVSTHNPPTYLADYTYDARGRALTAGMQMSAGGETRSFTLEWTYDQADRVKKVKYPTDRDNIFEWLTYGYNDAGQLVSAATPGNLYVESVGYDRFGRRTKAIFGRGVVADERRYSGLAADNYRLAGIEVSTGEDVLQDFRYGPYDPAGNLLGITDMSAVAGQYPDASARDNDWTYTYDGLGRLLAARWAGAPHVAQFDYDYRGNMRRGNLAFPNILASTDVAFVHDLQRPHHVNSITPPGSSSPVTYESGGANGDGNGGLLSRPATISTDLAKVFDYDVEGRVETVVVDGGGSSVESFYDHNGRRVARIVDGTDVAFFFGRLFEVRGARLTRHIYLGNQRVAFSPIDAPPGLALAASPGARAGVKLAQLAGEAQPGSQIYALGEPGAAPMVATAGTAVLLLLLVGLAFFPCRARVGLLGTVRRGAVMFVIVVFTVTLPPFPAFEQTPADRGALWAQCPLFPSFPVYFVHGDHLGSTTMLTTYKVHGAADGSVAEYYRYGPYGVMRAYDPAGNDVPSGLELTELTYTGQRWDAAAQLYYYGARFYDPLIARFVTPDPARQHPNGYTYVGWNPVQFIDPTGLLTVPNAGAAFALSLLSYDFAPGRDALASTALSRGLGGVIEDGTSSAAGTTAGTLAHGATARRAFEGFMQNRAEIIETALDTIADAAHAQGGWGLQTPANPVLSPNFSPDVSISHSDISVSPLPGMNSPRASLAENLVGFAALSATALSMAAVGTVHVQAGLGELGQFPQLTGTLIGTSGIFLGSAAAVYVLGDAVLLPSLGIALTLGGGIVAGTAINDYVVVPTFGGLTVGQAIAVGRSAR